VDCCAFLHADVKDGDTITIFPGAAPGSGNGKPAENLAAELSLLLHGHDVPQNLVCKHVE
jgi:hypothetical protein